MMYHTQYAVASRGQPVV